MAKEWTLSLPLKVVPVESLHHIIFDYRISKPEVSKLHHSN